MTKRRLPLLLLLVAALLVLPVFPDHLNASESAEGAHGEEGHGETIAQTIGKWVNFLALAAILFLFLRKTIGVQNIFKKEAEDIRRSIEGARQAKLEAEKRLEEMDQKMIQVNEEISRMKADAARDASEEKERILESAQREAERIVEMAHREIDSEVQRARKDLRKHIADLAVANGRKIIEEEINEEDQKKLMGSYIGSLGK